MALATTWERYDDGSVRLVEVRMDGVVIDLERVIVGPGRYEVRVMDDPPMREERGQLEMWGGE